MKLKKFIAALLAAAVTAASCVQAYAVNVPLTEDSPGTREITTSVETNPNSDANQDDGESSESWEANFVYDESTGILTWDEYTGADETDCEYILNVDGFGQIQMIDRSIYLPNLFASTCVYESGDVAAAKSGTSTITVTAWVHSSDKMISSEGSFTYTYDVGSIDSELGIPDVTKCTIERSRIVDSSIVHVILAEGTYTGGIFYRVFSGDYSTVGSSDDLLCGGSPCGDATHRCFTHELFADQLETTDDTEVYVQVCNVGVNGSIGEWSEPYLLVDETEHWEANFSYNEDTGILSWDDIIGSDKELRYQIDFFAPDYVESVDGENINEGYLESISGDGWGDMRLGVPNINLPLCLAVMSYHYIPDLFGEIRLKLYCTNGYEVVYSSSDSFVYNYDGRNVNTELEVPSPKVNGTNVTWDATEGAVGYLYSSDRETVFGSNNLPDSINEFTLTDDTPAIAVCSVDKNGDVSEWSELVSAADVPEGSWFANFGYHEEIGYLSWENPIAASGINVVDYSIIINDNIELPFSDSSPTYGGSPSYNLPLELARYNAINDEIPSGKLNIKVRLDTKVDFITEPVCVDSFSYTFEGKEGAENIGVPEITSVETELTDAQFRAFHLNAKMNEIENAVGYLMKFENSNSNITFCEYLSWNNGVTNWWYVPSDAKDTVRICAVDKNGNTGKWSEPFDFESPLWNANFSLDEKTGSLSFYGCPYAEEKAEEFVVYTFYAENSDGEVTEICRTSCVKSMFGGAGFIYPGKSMYNFKKGTYKLYITAASDTWNISAADIIGLSNVYTYVFKGGEINPDLKAPLLKNASAYQDGVYYTELDGYFYTSEGSGFAGSDVEIQLLTDGKSIVGYSSRFGCFSLEASGFSFETTLYNREVSGAKELSAKLRLIDKDGFYSEWSEPQPFTIRASFTDKNGFYNKIFNSNRGSYKNLYVNIGNDGNLGCGTQQDIHLPGVDYGETVTASELKNLLKGITVTDFDFSSAKVNGSPADITFDDLFYGVVVQTKDKDGNDRWNPKYFDFTMDFDATLTELNVGDDETVTNVLFQYGIKAETIERLGLKQGDHIELYFKTANNGENSFTYNETEDGLVITGGTINDPNVVIPSEINGKPVVEIGANAFNFNGDIETLVISENVKRIDWYAFNTCEKLTEVTLPESLEYIDNWAFERCSSLKTVNIPKNVAHVGSGAFAQNTSMLSINCDPANGSYVSVDGVLFTKDMKELTAYPCGRNGSYTVPESVNHIGNAAFYGAKKLSAVEISGTLDFIGFEAFAECELLNNVNINDGVNYVGYWAFRGCTGIKQLTVPQSVTNIGDQAFGFRYVDNKYDDFSLRGYKDSFIYYYAKRHDIPFVIIGDADKENSPFKEENAVEEPVTADPSKAEKDCITSITINPAFNMKNKNEAGVGINLTKIKIKAEEIYQDEESIRRAEEALGNIIKGNKHYNLLDLTLLYNGEDFSNRYDGLVEVIIPIPAGHRDKEFYCYRIVDNNGTPEKELIPGKRVEDSYIIYLEHFSTYAFVGDGDHEHSFSENWESDGSNHWHECSCGEISDSAAHTASEPITENGVKYTECTVCGRILSKENVSDTDTPETPSNPTTGSSFGTFVSPNTTTESATAETSTSSPETTAPQTSADNTDTTSEGTTQGSASDNFAAPSDNNTDGNADINTGNGAANEDKNQNTGVTLAVIPVLAAAAGIIFSKKRK